MPYLASNFWSHSFPYVIAAKDARSDTRIWSTIDIDPKTGEVLEQLDMPQGIFISGLEIGGDTFYCGGGPSGKIRAVKRPKKSSAIFLAEPWIRREPIWASLPPTSALAL